MLKAIDQIDIGGIQRMQVDKHELSCRHTHVIFFSYFVIFFLKKPEKTSFFSFNVENITNETIA